MLCFTLSIMVICVGNIITSNHNKNSACIQEEYFEMMKSDNEIKKKDLGIFIDINAKILYLMDINRDILIKKYIVATGKSSTPTPIGSFKIIQKGKWGEGFGTRWMKLSVPWGKYGIHGTDRPGSIGYNASHGCVRMKNKDIEELYDIVPYNTPVILFKGTFGAFSDGFRVLRPGDRGSDVYEVQIMLKKKGYYNGYVDGIYGNYMKMVLYNFMKDNNLPISDLIDYKIYKLLDIKLID